MPTEKVATPSRSPEATPMGLTNVAGLVGENGGDGGVPTLGPACGSPSTSATGLNGRGSLLESAYARRKVPPVRISTIVLASTAPILIVFTAPIRRPAA